MDASTRSAVIRRFQKIAGIDSVVPTHWDQIGNLTLKLQIESNDPELAQVLKGQMSGDLEERVLAGKWADQEAPAPRDFQAERAAAIDAAMAQLTFKTQEQLESDLKQRLADGEQQRRNSAVMATGRWSQG